MNLIDQLKNLERAASSHLTNGGDKNSAEAEALGIECTTARSVIADAEELNDPWTTLENAIGNASGMEPSERALAKLAFRILKGPFNDLSSIAESLRAIELNTRPNRP